MSRYRDALVLSRTCGSVFEEARAETGLGTVAAARHDVDAAHDHWTRALGHYRALRAPQATVVEHRLAALNAES